VYDPTAASFYALPFAQLALAVGGVLAWSSEYSTGTIRASLTAVPRRGRFLAAKAAVFTLVALAGAQVSNVAPAPNALPAWAGLGLTAALTAAVLAAALVRLRTADA
jgi:hypothetical protein